MYIEGSLTPKATTSKLLIIIHIPGDISSTEGTSSHPERRGVRLWGVGGLVDGGDGGGEDGGAVKVAGGGGRGGVAGCGGDTEAGEGWGAEVSKGIEIALEDEEEDGRFVALL